VIKRHKNLVNFEIMFVWNIFSQLKIIKLKQIVVITRCRTYLFEHNFTSQLDFPTVPKYLEYFITFQTRIWLIITNRRSFIIPSLDFKESGRIFSISSILNPNLWNVLNTKVIFYHILKYFFFLQLLIII